MASPTLPVTIEDLKVLVPMVSDAAAQIFIDSADAIVQEKVISAGYAPRTTYLIELYLAAHFASYSGTEGGGLIRIKVGMSEESYADPTDGQQGIANSRFGLQALALDTAGTLASLAASPVKAEFKVYGRDST